MITQLIEFDVKKDSHVKITAKEGDINSRNLEFRLLDNSLPFSLAGRTVRCYMVKPDKRIVFSELQIIDAEDGRCVLTLSLQSLIVSGMAKLELIIYEAGKKLSVIPIKMNIIRSLNSDKLLESTNEFGALNDALWKIDTFTETMNSKASKEDLKKLSSQLDTSVKFKVIGEGASVPPISGDTMQLYIDEKKEIKGYPITSPDRVIDENGISVKEELITLKAKVEDIEAYKVTHADISADRGYRLYKDGYCRCWNSGIRNISGNALSITVTLPYTFKNKASCSLTARFIGSDNIPINIIAKMDSGNTVMLYYPENSIPQLANGNGSWFICVEGY